MSSKKKTVIVTGATGVIGSEIVRLIAEKGFAVVMMARNETKLKNLQERLIKKTGNEDISYDVVDFSLQSSVMKMRKNWGEKPLYGLLCNHAVVPPNRMESTDGIELQFATNVLGYYWTIEAFKSLLIQNAPSRLVLVASRYAFGLDLGNPESKGSYSPNDQYAASKQANRMMARYYAKELIDKNVFVNSCHPGVTKSNVLSNLGFGSGWDTAEKSAKTPSMLITRDHSDNVVKNVGSFYVYGKIGTNKFGGDWGEIERLMDVLKTYTKNL